MKDFNTSLLREKFIIHSPDRLSPPFIAVSNRMLIELKNDKGELVESFIVRAHNMHSCIRMSAHILRSFEQNGSLLNGATPFNWENIWDMTVNNYEYQFNPNRWVAIYNKGKVIYEAMERHPFLDVIEKCEKKNKGDYKDSVAIAEKAFQKTGTRVKIEYEGNIALVVNLESQEGKCSIILRSPKKTTTFNFSITPKNEEGLVFFQCLSSSAAFLDAIQLSFLVGLNESKVNLGLSDNLYEDEKQIREAYKHIARLEAEIYILENGHHIHYRPEKPNFQQITHDASGLI